ncbi:MAG: 50S ribosomal protein L4 [Acidobacteriia bacterium]|nr:50S ribosomal protein L4 [Terriglobia bacterium]
MPVVDVVNLDGKKVGQVDLADSVFAAKVNAHLLHEASRWYLAGERAGTHKTKVRSEVRGSGKKLWKQKGTGRARMGSIRSSIWRKGGTVHGPQPRDYSYALPKKMVLGALRSALSEKLAEQKLTIVDGWALETNKTKALRTTLDKLNGQKTILLVESGENRNLQLASRNLAGVKLVAPHVLQPYDLLRHDRLICSKDAAARLSRTLNPEKPAVEAGLVATIAPAPAANVSAAPEKKAAAPKAAAKKAEKPAAKKAAKPAKSSHKAKGKD